MLPARRSQRAESAVIRKGLGKFVRSPQFRSVTDGSLMLHGLLGHRQSVDSVKRSLHAGPLMAPL